MTPEEKLKFLPARPGVYYFKDNAGEIIYVGKAVSLKNRLRSYYQKEAKHIPKVRSLMARAVNFEYIVTDNEIEALILESNLIKKHRPRYNVFLKDDKSYPYLKVTLVEDFPRVHITRRLVKDGSRYFGPYTQVGAVNETLKLLRKIFPFRTCKQKITENNLKKQGRPCLNYHIRRCLAPCCGLIDKRSYNEMIQEVCLFLEGRQEDLVKRLTLRMNDAAKKLEFEKAAELRDQIQAVQKVIEKQKVISISRKDQDIIALAKEDIFCIMVFYARAGKLIGREPFYLSDTEGMSNAEVITAFIKQYYHRSGYIPEEIHVSEIDPKEKEVIKKWLSQKKGSSVRLYVPRRGEKKKMIDMVAQNAMLSLRETRLERQNEVQVEKAFAELARKLELDRKFMRVECYDISNIQGSENVASMVVFEKGYLSNNQYRRFKIKTVEGPNDYACLQEVIKRRFTRAEKEQKLLDSGQLSIKEAGFYRLPDLVIVDGGKGQLNVVQKTMQELGYSSIPVISIAKEQELIFIEGRDTPVRLPRNSPALQLVQKLRDEAHRFAITYHRKLRTKRNLKSCLDEIEGIGPVRRRALLKAFSSLEAISKASVEELASVSGMNRPAAQAVYQYFH